MPVLTRQPPETEEEKRRRLLGVFGSRPLETSSDVLAPAPMARTPSPSLVDSPSSVPDTSPILRQPDPLNYVPPEPYVIYNNKGRPTGAGGGFSSLSRNQALLEAQQSYKPKGSTKNLLLQLGLSFLRGGLPGVAAGGLQYAADPAGVDRAQMERAMGQTEGAINLDLNRQHRDSQAAVQQAQIEALKRKPLEDAQKAMEQERDNLRQLYNSQPYFDPEKNPQHKAMAARAAQLNMVLPTRDEKDDSQVEWINGQAYRVSRSGRHAPEPLKDTTGQPLVRQAEVPVTEDGLTVTPGQALNYRGQAAQRDASRLDLVGQRQTTATAAQARLQEAQTAADAYQKQLDELDKSAGSITTYEPATTIDKETGTQVVLKNANGGVAYTNKKSAERLQYEQARKDLESKRDAALAEARKAQSEARSIYTPSLQRSGAGPQWSASKWAKANPNGDVSAAKAAARAAGYQVIE